METRGGWITGIFDVSKNAQAGLQGWAGDAFVLYGGAVHFGRAAPRRQAFRSFEHSGHPLWEAAANSTSMADKTSSRRNMFILLIRELPAVSQARRSASLSPSRIVIS
jgi:hypothetical protein